MDNKRGETGSRVSTETVSKLGSGAGQVDRISRCSFRKRVRHKPTAQWVGRKKFQVGLLCLVGAAVGFTVGVAVGAAVGAVDGAVEGETDGAWEGVSLGEAEGAMVGAAEGGWEGEADGVSEGGLLGAADGLSDGLAVGAVLGADEGAMVGVSDGVVDGETVGSSLKDRGLVLNEKESEVGAADARQSKSLHRQNIISCSPEIGAQEGALFQGAESESEMLKENECDSSGHEGLKVGGALGQPAKRTVKTLRHGQVIQATWSGRL